MADYVYQYNFATWRVTVTHTVTVTVFGSKVLMVLKVLEVLTYHMRRCEMRGDAYVARPRYRHRYRNGSWE